MQEGLFQVVEGGEFFLVEGFEILNFARERIETFSNTLLISNGGPCIREIFDLLTADMRNTDSSLNTNYVSYKCRATNEIRQKSVVEACSATQTCRPLNEQTGKVIFGHGRVFQTCLNPGAIHRQDNIALTKPVPVIRHRIAFGPFLYIIPSQPALDYVVSSK